MRLPRPYIPLSVRCLVALRQLGEMWPERKIGESRQLASLLAESLDRIATLLNCQAGDLHLDHNPALAARQKVRDKSGSVLRYIPDANDPEHLVYRERHAHHIKTNVHGDGAQYPDRVLIKRERRREKPGKPKRKAKFPSRPFPKGRQKIPSRPFPKRGK